MLAMNIMWLEEGKRFTIAGIFGIALCVFGILFTENTLQAAVFGALLVILIIITVKAAIGWSRRRGAEKRRKLKHAFNI